MVKQQIAAYRHSRRVLELTGSCTWLRLNSDLLGHSRWVNLIQANTNLVVSARGACILLSTGIHFGSPGPQISASTWNNAAVPFTLIKANVTDTASAAGSKFTGFAGWWK